MLAADAELQLVARFTAAAGGDVDQFAHALDIEGGERVVLEDAALAILLEERGGVVAAETKGSLGEIVGAEAEELGRLGDLGGAQRGARQFDHEIGRASGRRW